MILELVDEDGRRKLIEIEEIEEFGDRLSIIIKNGVHFDLYFSFSRFSSISVYGEGTKWEIIKQIKEKHDA